MTLYKGLTRDELWYENLQGNILKSNGRENQTLMFVQIGKTPNIDNLKLFFKSLTITSFSDQLKQSKKNRNTGATQVLFTQVMFARTMYEKLGIDSRLIPRDLNFKQGLRTSTAANTLSSNKQWDLHITDFDFVILLASSDINQLSESVNKFTIDIEKITTQDGFLSVQSGSNLKNEKGDIIEHFGIRDGVSNPVFLREDIDKINVQQGVDKFNPIANKELALVTDPLTGDYGSYVSLLKFEQDKDVFESTIKAIKEKFGLDSVEDAIGLIIGRKSSGEPLVTTLNDNCDMGNINNFDFSKDSDGKKCPFNSHIRKMNDRSESLRQGKGFDDTLKHRIIRRGFSYQSKNNSGKDGLIFLAYQANIANQFEMLLEKFANNVDYPQNHSGADALIGKSTITNRTVYFTDVDNKKYRHEIPEFIKLLGGQYLFTPSVSFFKNIDTIIENNGNNQKNRSNLCSTYRTKQLRDRLVVECFSNRSKRWFKTEELGHVINEKTASKGAPVIIRQAYACKKILETMMTPSIGSRTRTYGVHADELIVGTLPMGSVGLGKQFPKYLTDEEVRVSSLSNRDEGSIFGHTVPNFQRILSGGLLKIIEECDVKSEDNSKSKNQQDFYSAVSISSKAVIDYAEAMAIAAEEGCKLYRDKEGNQSPGRIDELEEIARICRTVPAKPARSFQEALQCIWFIHLAQTAFCVFNSFGRLDVLLQPYLEKDLSEGKITESKAIELVECFLIKGAERLNLNPAHLKEQDNLSYGTGIGTRPIYLDQIASCNNFIQNIVLGGRSKTEDKDVYCTTTKVFLKAAGGVGLCTPTIDVRVHKNSPEELLDLVDETFRRAQTGHPILFNDDAIIPGMLNSNIPTNLANDYAVAGCWEPVMNGQSSFIFGMVNMLRVLECALNEGKFFNPDEQFLKGQKQSFNSPPTSEYIDFDHLYIEVVKQMAFWADKVALGTCTFFKLPNAMTPSPFFSMLLDGCLERGQDQSEGGADINLISSLAFGVPNAVNALANIKHYVFDEKQWTLDEVADALRSNWGTAPVKGTYEDKGVNDKLLIDKYQKIRRTFLNSPFKYGNNEDTVDKLMSCLLSDWSKVNKSAEKLAKKAFLSTENDNEAKKLRAMANYPAASFKTSMRPDMSLHFTSGSGTFGQYSSMGKGVSASADGRAAHDPVVPNCSPATGTCSNGLSGFWDSLKKQKLSQFGSAVVTDIRVDGDNQPPNFFVDLIKNWVASEGSMLTVSVLSTEECEKMFLLTQEIGSHPERLEELFQYCDRFCRVGGWNSNFICLPRAQQRDHTNRATW